MAYEKQYTARQAAQAILRKAEEMLQKNSHILIKSEKTENDPKLNAKPSEHGAKDADQHAEGAAPKGEIKPNEKEQAPSDNVEPTDANAVARNGNPEWGTDPKVYGHIKLSKFIGHMEAKRKMRKGI